MLRSFTRVLPPTRLHLHAATHETILQLARTRVAPMATAVPIAAAARVCVTTPIVTVDWLKSNYAGVKTVDGSWYMPHMRQDASANFLSGRLPSAVFFDLEACTSKEGPNAQLPHMMPSKEQFAAYMGQLGLQRDDAIVVYDGLGIFSAPRIRLTMRHFGATNVAILEGGFKAWKAAGGEIESGPPTAPTPSVFDAQDPPSGFVRELAAVRANSVGSSATDAAFQLVDARSKGRFDGVEPEPRPDLPSGHIAGSTNVPFTSLLESHASGGTVMKSPDAIQRVFESAGVDIQSPTPLVGTCGSGVTACVVLLGLELAGRSHSVGLYDGSWTEWASRGDEQQYPRCTNKGN